LSYTGTAWPFEGMGSMEAWTLPLSDTRTTVSEITRGRELTDRTTADRADSIENYRCRRAVVPAIPRREPQIVGSGA